MATKKTFKSLLRNLTAERNKIGELTEQARADLQYDENLAANDVKAIVSHIINQPADKRLAGIYLLDSICQNVGGQFVPLFEEHVDPIMETTHRYGSQTTRKRVCKILTIWKSRNIFPIAILKNIYNKLSQNSGSNQKQPPPRTVPSFQQAVHFRAPPVHNQYPPPHNHFAGPPHGQFGPRAVYPHPPPPHMYNNQPPPHGPYPPFGRGPIPAHPPMGYGPPPPRGHIYNNNMGPPRNGMNHMLPPNHNGHNVNGHQYAQTVRTLVEELWSFMQNPYGFRNGLFTNTPRLKSAQWTCRRELMDQVRGFRMALDNDPNKDITRNLYFVTNALKDEGVNTGNWEQSLRQIAPFLGGDARHKGHRNKSVGICPMFNSEDGCRRGDNCPMQHVTDAEAELKRALSERVAGRYEVSEVKVATLWPGKGRRATFYSYFGEKDLRKKTARSISLLYSKKLRQCPNCSLRVSEGAFQKHMAWHFQRRKAILRRKQNRTRIGADGITTQQSGMNRGWFRSEDAWLNAVDKNTADPKEKDVNPFEEHNGLPPELTVKQQTTSSSNDKTWSVVIGGRSEVVVCAICRVEFAVSSKEYNAQRDDWMLTGACYADGTTTTQMDTPPGIVHRTCFEAEQRAKSAREGNHDDNLIPKLMDPDSAISKFENRLNDRNEDSPVQRTSVKRKRPRSDNLIGPSDDEEDEEEEMKIVKKRKLNEERDTEVIDVEEDLQGIDLDEEEGVSRTITIVSTEMLEKKKMEVKKVTVEVRSDTQPQSPHDIKNAENPLDEQQQKDDGDNVPNSPSLSVDTVEPEAEKDLDAIDDDEDLEDIDDEDLESEDDDDIVLLNLDADPQGFY